MLIILSIIILSGCTSIDHVQLAEKYKLELQYYDYAVKFEENNMTSDAYSSCNRTATLRNECFTSLVMMEMAKNNQPESEWCDEIVPTQKINMTKKAFQIVYPVQDDNLKKELSQKLSPSENRIRTLTQIKDNCIKLAR
jgi:hypothetical protein